MKRNQVFGDSKITVHIKKVPNSASTMETDQMFAKQTPKYRFVTDMIKIVTNYPSLVLFLYCFSVLNIKYESRRQECLPSFLTRGRPIKCFINTLIKYCYLSYAVFSEMQNILISTTDKYVNSNRKLIVSAFYFIK